MSLLLALESDRVSAGPLGLLIIVLMMIATVLLIRSMNGRITKLPREFPPPVQEPAVRPPKAPRSPNPPPEQGDGPPTQTAPS